MDHSAGIGSNSSWACTFLCVFAQVKCNRSHESHDHRGKEKKQRCLCGCIGTCKNKLPWEELIPFGPGSRDRRQLFLSRSGSWIMVWLSCQKRVSKPFFNNQRSSSIGHRCQFGVWLGAFFAIQHHPWHFWSRIRQPRLGREDPTDRTHRGWMRALNALKVHKVTPSIPLLVVLCMQSWRQSIVTSLFDRIRATSIKSNLDLKLAIPCRKKRALQIGICFKTLEDKDTANSKRGTTTCTVDKGTQSNQS